MQTYFEEEAEFTYTCTEKYKHRTVADGKTEHMLKTADTEIFHWWIRDVLQSGIQECIVGLTLL